MTSERVYLPLNEYNYSSSNATPNNSVPIITNTTSVFSENINIDITTENSLKNMYTYAILLFGIASIFCTTLIFMFGYLWYAVIQNYEKLETIAISSITISIIGLISSLVLFVIVNKKYKDLYRLEFDQRIFINN